MNIQNIFDLKEGNTIYYKGTKCLITLINGSPIDPAITIRSDEIVETVKWKQEYINCSFYPPTIKPFKEILLENCGISVQKVYEEGRAYRDTNRINPYAVVIPAPDVTIFGMNIRFDEQLDPGQIIMIGEKGAVRVEGLNN